jgi:hypothetical protein
MPNPSIVPPSYLNNIRSLQQNTAVSVAGLDGLGSVELESNGSSQWGEEDDWGSQEESSEIVTPRGAILVVEAVVDDVIAETHPESPPPGTGAAEATVHRVKVGDMKGTNEFGSGLRSGGPSQAIPSGDVSGLADDEPPHVTSGDDTPQNTSEGGSTFAEVYLTTQSRKKGHFVHCVYIVMASVLTIVLGIQLSPERHTVLCPTYLNTILPLILLLDFVIVQPVVVALTYGYRWITSDTVNGQPFEMMLHPRDSLVRLEETE